MRLITLLAQDFHWYLRKTIKKPYLVYKIFLSVYISLNFLIFFLIIQLKLSDREESIKKWFIKFGFTPIPAYCIFFCSLILSYCN